MTVAVTSFVNMAAPNAPAACACSFRRCRRGTSASCASYSDRRRNGYVSQCWINNNSNNNNNTSHDNTQQLTNIYIHRRDHMITTFKHVTTSSTWYRPI